MSGSKSDWSGGVEAMGRQVWEAWSEALGKAASAPLESTAPAWQQMPGGWPGWAPPKADGVGEVLQRFDGLARHWFGRMQHVATKFADRDNTPQEIAAAWRQAMGATETRPDPDLFAGLFGLTSGGLDGLGEKWLPWLESLRAPLQDWANMPAFGPAREHQQRWKTLLQTQQVLQDAQEGFQHLLQQASRQAYGLFEDKLGRRAEQGAPLDSARALFDEWIDAAEEAYAAMALSEEFGKVYGALTNAQMRMRAGVQREVEQIGGMLGLPSRTEVDAAHRKIAELERALRTLMRGAAGEASASSSKPRTGSVAKNTTPQRKRAPPVAASPKRKPAAKPKPAASARKVAKAAGETAKANKAASRAATSRGAAKSVPVGKPRPAAARKAGTGAKRPS